MPQPKKNYRAKVRLYSKKYKRTFEPGEMIDLSHATDEDIDGLLKQGAIENPSAAPTAPAPDEGELNG